MRVVSVRGVNGSLCANCDLNVISFGSRHIYEHQRGCWGNRIWLSLLCRHPQSDRSTNDNDDSGDGEFVNHVVS